MSMDNFKPGDEVVLKSGGPRMTVDRLTERSVVCKWFVSTTLQTGTFSADALQSAPVRGPAVRYARTSKGL